jgi:hypothetical protein
LTGSLHINSIEFVSSSGRKMPVFGTMNGGFWKSVRPNCTLAFVNGWADIAVNALELGYQC